MPKPRLFILVGEARHFLKWELPYWRRHFRLVATAGPDTPLLAFGPDVMGCGIEMPASHRFITTFPGFGHNPLYNAEARKQHLELLAKYRAVFITRGPLELAYNTLPNLVFYSFSVDAERIPHRCRKALSSLLHASSNYPQKDRARSQLIMELTGLDHEVYPPRVQITHPPSVARRAARRIQRAVLGAPPAHGYGPHRELFRKYLQHDGFVHIARDIHDPIYIDGKYTATLIEAGLSGSLVFWHDTLGLGNDYETVFSLPMDPPAAARCILDISTSIDISRHSRETRTELLDKHRPDTSVLSRANHMLSML